MAGKVTLNFFDKKGNLFENKIDTLLLIEPKTNLEGNIILKFKVNKKSDLIVAKVISILSKGECFCVLSETFPAMKQTVQTTGFIINALATNRLELYIKPSRQNILRRPR